MEKPKLKLSVLLSRSGYLLVKSASVGTMHLNSPKQIKKPCQLSTEALAAAKKRLKWHKKRDEDKVKTDIAKNDYESMIYKMREWLREDENEAYVEEEQRTKWLEDLAEMEDQLYEAEGQNANHTVYEKKHSALRKAFDQFSERKDWYEQQAEFRTGIEKTLEAYVEKVEKLSETKPWISNEQLKDVTDKIEETRKWFNVILEKQEKLPKTADPIVNLRDVMAKLEKLKKLYTKVAKTKKPKPPKEDKPKKDEDAEDFADGEEDASNTTAGSNKTESGKDKKSKGDKKAKKEAKEDL